MRKKSIACKTPRSRSTSIVTRRSNSVDQVAAVGYSSPNRCEDDDKSKQSDGGSPETFVAAVGDSSPNKCEDDEKSKQSDKGSPDIFSQEKTESDKLEKSRCIKCDKVGKMLVCTEIGCPVAIHEECLTPKPYFDDSGNFYCPYCAYKRAVDKVQRLRKKAVSAKEQLSKFLKVAAVDSVGGKEQENETKEKAATALPQSEDRNQHADEIQPNRHVDENMAAVSEKCDLEAMEDEESHHQEDRDLEETPVMKEHKKIASPEKTKKAAGESPKGDASEFHPAENVENQSNESHNESVSEGSVEQNANAPKSSTHVRKNRSCEKKELNVFPSQGKRKRMNWTPEEEEMLKDGVQIFSDPNKKNLPWRKILQFGSHVFHQSRLPADLQSKWKNMTRKN